MISYLLRIPNNLHNEIIDCKGYMSINAYILESVKEKNKNMKRLNKC